MVRLLHRFRLSDAHLEVSSDERGERSFEVDSNVILSPVIASEGFWWNGRGVLFLAAASE